jgi:restriction system protein
MIENPEPKEWKALQAGICRLFKEIGLHAEENKIVATPRGTVSLDVFAVDPGSVDSIQYVVECKNWKNSIPQGVVHAFTTVMHEVGANIGYIISKKGIQKGAKKYLQNTNIKGMTYADLQQHYLRMWIERQFCYTIWNVADALIQYTEPINSRRERYRDSLSPVLNDKFRELYDKYCLFGMAMLMISAGTQKLIHSISGPPDISAETLNKIITETLGDDYKINTNYLREFLEELVRLVENITEKFNDIFGKNIFAQQKNRGDRE